MTLQTQSRLRDPDAVYDELIRSVGSLTEEDALAFCARLILLLSNHIGDVETVKEAIVLASVSPRAQDSY